MCPIKIKYYIILIKYSLTRIKNNFNYVKYNKDCKLFFYFKKQIG